MRSKRYRINCGVLRFEDGVTVFEDYLNIPDTVHTIDFNEVQHILKPFSLRKNPITVLDFKKVLTVRTVVLPDNVRIIENLYWAENIEAKNPVIIESPRLQVLGIYNRRDLI
ncbi:MAG: hypothetical protein KAR20_26645, partial [Candidatus Heimdallarchaeota archaeon]|nr:hypothetical protein [Candidatus Heimdallarchaeota archaeon]